MSLATPLPQPRSPLVDVVVVGAGVMGAAAAWQPRPGRREGRCCSTGSRAGHTRGASHGASRILPPCLPIEPVPAPSPSEALPLWRELEAETGAELLTITGGIDHGDSATASAIAARSDHPRRAARVARRRSDAALSLAGHALRRPRCCTNPTGAGRIDADHAVAAPHRGGAGSRRRWSADR